MSGRPSHEVAEVFRRLQDSAIPVPAPKPEQRRVVHRILRCRTAALGGHVDACSDCGHREISYNSCRDRHCPKCQGSAQADSYLARYTRRVAISNHRLVSLDDQRVRFRFKDYRGRRLRHQILSLPEFARRFLLHVLPRGFVRIRYYGLLAHACRRRMLSLCRLALQTPVDHADPLPAPPTGPGRFVDQLLPIPPQLCPACKKTMLACVQILERPPPFLMAPHAHR